jgi:hypothetical protein
MRIDSAGNVGIGTTSLTGISLGINKNITGATTSSGAYINSTIQSDVTTNGIGFRTSISTQATAFTLTSLYHYYAAQSTIGAGSTVTNQYGFAVDNGLTGATNNYGFHSNIASASNRWNFYAAGTAANYMAGQLQLGDGTAAAPALSNFGDENTGIFFPAADTIAFAEGGAEVMRIDSSGNVAIGATSAAGRLLVVASDGTAPNNTAANGALKVRSTATAAVGAGPSITFEGQTGNSTTNYAFAGIQGFKGSAVAADYSGVLAFYTQNSLGSTALTERMRIDVNGYLLVGTTASQSVSSGNVAGNIQVENNGSSSITNVRNSNNASPGIFAFGKSRGTTFGSRTIVASGDILGSTNYDGADGTNFITAANIFAQVDGTPGTNDMPGRLCFGTTADGASSPTERMRIDSSGNVGIGTSSPGYKLDVLGNVNRFAGASVDGIFLSTVAATDTSFYGANYFNNNGTEGVNASGRASWRIATLTAGSPTFSIGYRAPNAAAGTFTDAMTLDASGNLLVGTTTPVFNAAGRGLITINGSSAAALGFTAGAVDKGIILHTGTDMIMSNSVSGAMTFQTNNTERARIDSSGNFFVNKTSVDDSVAGVTLQSAGTVRCSRPDSLAVFNRLSTDGTLVEFLQAGALEGSISVSGSTVTYGGGHLARFGQLPDGSEDPTLLKGTVLTNLDEMCVWINKETGIPADNEQCNKVKISDVDGDANVAGVFVSWTYDEQHDTNDLYVAMTGDMIIRIAQGVTVQRGDLLMSAGNGTAKPQGDDIVRSKTVAKVTSTHVTCTYADGSFCVPCVLMAC